MNDTELFPLRKIILIFAAVVGLVLVAWLIWYIATHGYVTLRATESSKITIARLDSSGKPVATATSRFAGMLPNGDYIVTAQDSTQQTREHIKVAPFAPIDRAIQLTQTTFSEPVMNIGATNFAVSTRGLSFLDPSSGALAIVDDTNTYSATDTTHFQIESASWRSVGKGLAVARSYRDNKKMFVETDDTTLTELSLPRPLTDQTYFAFLATQLDHDYVLLDGTLYSRTPTGTYTAITTTDKSSIILSASQKYVALFYRSGEESCEVRFVSLADKSITKKPVDCIQSPDYTYAAEWSSDGKYVAITTGSSVGVYDDTLKLVYTVPDPDASSPLWLKDHELVYVSGNSVWKYDTDSKASRVLAAVPTYADVRSLRRTEDGTSLYYTGSASNLLTLYRLVAKEPDTNLQKISESNTQQLSESCRMRYVNFTKLTILLGTSASAQAACDSLVDTYFNAVGIPRPPSQYILNEEMHYSD